MAKNLTTQDTLSMIDSFLKPVRDRMQKEAATQSQMDTVTPEKLQKPEAGDTNQTNLGKEQSAEAHQGKANADTIAPIKDSDGKRMEDNLGPNTLTVDDKVTQSQIGTPTYQQISQKIAANVQRADTLSDKILEYLAAGLEQQKQASTPQQEELPEGYSELLKEAQDMAQQYYEGYVFARLKRAQDEAEVRASGVTDEMCAVYGGVSGLLDKIAADDMTAVLPEEAVAEMGAAEMPMEMGGEEAGIGEEEIYALAADLEANNVTEEDLASAMAEVEALIEQGVPPEVIMEAVEEELAAAEGAPMEDAPMEDAALEEAELEQLQAEKLASDNRQLKARVLQVIRGKR